MEKEAQKKQLEDGLSVIRDILKNWWVILFVAVAAAMWTYIAASFLYEPSYTSRTTFVVSAKGSATGAYANQSKTQKLTDTFQSVLDSQVLKKKVADSLGYASFDGTVSISVVPETNLLTVSVTSGSPDHAFKLLNGMLDNYQEVSKNVLGEVVMEVFEEPNFPSRPNQSFNGRGYMKKGFLAAAALMILLLGLASYTRDSIKSREDVSRKLDTTLFGVLGHEKAYRSLWMRLRRKKKKQLITEPSVSFGYVESIKKMRTKLLYQYEKDPSKVILVTSTAKKEGKTTIAANLALALAQRKKKVLLIEGDLQKMDLAALMGVEVPDEMGISKNLNRQTDLKSLVYKTDELPVSLLVNKAPHNRSAEFLGSRRFAEFLNVMREEMDFIIIDGPAVKGRADAEVLARRSDASLLVVKQNDLKVQFINDTIDILNHYGKGVLGCVLNHAVSGLSVFTSGYGYGYGSYRYGGYYGYGKYGYGYGYGKYGSYYSRQHEKAKRDKEKEDRRKEKEE